LAKKPGRHLTSCNIN